VAAAVVLAWAAPASALDLGGVSGRVPMRAPVVALSTAPANLPVADSARISVAMPPAVRVGPVGVNAGAIAPGIASLAASPAEGVGVDVALPISVGPVALPAGAPNSIPGSVDEDGTNAATPTGVTLAGAPTGASPNGVTLPGAPTIGSTTAVPPLPDTPQIGPAVLATGPSAASASRSSPARVSRDRTASATAGSSRPGSAAAAGDAHVSTAGATPARPATDAPLGSVNASLQHPAPEQSSSLWRVIDAVGSRQGLLVALLALVLVARFAAAGLLRDALRKRRSTVSL
jgi:hypothetical protein